MENAEIKWHESTEGFEYNGIAVHSGINRPFVDTDAFMTL